MLSASSLKRISAAQLCCCTALTAQIPSVSERSILDIGGERNVSDIHLEAQWSDPLLGLLFLYHCREEKLGGSSQALCSTSPAGQDNLAVVLTPPKNPQSHIKLSHCSTKGRTQLPLIYSTAHFSAPHNTRVMTQRKSQR